MTLLLLYIVLSAIGLSVVPIMENYLGFSYEVALASVISFQFLMMLPPLSGVPFVAGNVNANASISHHLFR